MNCHGNNKNRENRKHNPIKHMLMMVLMMGMMFKDSKNGSCCSGKKEVDEN
ncbi:hypothetical protein ACN077_05690 [Clostridium chromiireducens]|uniref:hypothetical protein n=1 Tax=Clostridium chromiireducens TaxID=225345 RepID=UPI003AF43223